MGMFNMTEGKRGAPPGGHGSLQQGLLTARLQIEKGLAKRTYTNVCS